MLINRGVVKKRYKKPDFGQVDWYLYCCVLTVATGVVLTMLFSIALLTDLKGINSITLALFQLLGVIGKNIYASRERLRVIRRESKLELFFINNWLLNITLIITFVSATAYDWFINHKFL